jgi:hypothetical protein|tara:strand:- start:2083 stop:2568 length:486 start_codon:yes stop_codon:yes gene_type:complete
MNIKIFGIKCRIEIIISCLIIGFLIAMFTTCSCSKITPSECKKIIKNSSDIVKEGFQKISNLSNSSSVNYSMGKDNKGSWTQKALGYASEMGFNNVLASKANYKGTEVPLSDTMVFFKNNSFKPECCPSTYSSSNGCACTSIAQLNYLNERGGNRTSNSEF